MTAGIEPLIPAFVARQRWFGGTDVGTVEVVDHDVFRDDFPKLEWMLCDVDGHLYQLVLGGRPMGEAAEFLGGHEGAVLGDVDGVFWYDAVLDPELAFALLDRINAVLKSNPKALDDLERPITLTNLPVYEDQLSAALDKAAR